jgi:uncharacterized protein GlcG (DUF336 family)
MGTGEILRQRNLGIDLAIDAANATLETARARGYHIAVAVTDRSGHILVLLRSDGGGPHLLDAARRKAYTAASANMRTSAMETAVDNRTGVPDHNLIFLEGMLMVGGGVPIRAGEELVGAIGVAGSPGAIHDEECADAGIAHIAKSLT